MQWIKPKKCIILVASINQLVAMGFTFSAQFRLSEEPKEPSYQFTLRTRKLGLEKCVFNLSHISRSLKMCLKCLYS